MLLISYDEVTFYKQSAIVDLHGNGSSSSQFDTSDDIAGDDECVQYVCDNLDHNMKTLIGNGSFHGMASIVVRNGGTNHLRKQSTRRIPRLKERMSADFIKNISGVKIIPYSCSPKQLQKHLILSPIDKEKLRASSSNNAFLTTLWHSGLSIETPKRPNWSGFMETATSGYAQVLNKSRIDFLPIINMNPNDMSCIYSTLKYLEEHARKMQLKHCPCVTFDQYQDGLSV